MEFLCLQEASLVGRISPPPQLRNIVESQPEFEFCRKTDLSSHSDSFVYLLCDFEQVTRKMGKIARNFSRA